MKMGAILVVVWLVIGVVAALTTTVDPSEREDARRSPPNTCREEGIARRAVQLALPSAVSLKSCRSPTDDRARSWIEALVSVVKIFGPTCRHLTSSERRDSGVRIVRL